LIYITKVTSVQCQYLIFKVIKKYFEQSHFTHTHANNLKCTLLTGTWDKVLKCGKVSIKWKCYNHFNFKIIKNDYTFYDYTWYSK